MPTEPMVHVEIPGQIMRMALGHKERKKIDEIRKKLSGLGEVKFNEYNKLDNTIVLDVTFVKMEQKNVPRVMAMVYDFTILPTG